MSDGAISNRGHALHDHILAMESLYGVVEECKAPTKEATADYNERKKIAGEEGFDPDMLEIIRKRRAQGFAATQAHDDLLSEYEHMIEQAEAHKKRDPFADMPSGVASITIGTGETAVTISRNDSGEFESDDGYLLDTSNLEPVDTDGDTLRAEVSNHDDPNIGLHSEGE